MSEGTRTVTVALTTAELEQLEARAYTLSASIPGVARDLIRTGLAGGDNKTLADRLMLIERRIVALEQLMHDTHARVLSSNEALSDLLAMFDDLLKALTVDGTGRAA